MMTREYPNAPVAGVGAVILDARGHVVLVKRGREPLKGRWSLPGGAIELGETSKQAAAREALEETGLVVGVGDVVEVVDHLTTDTEGRVQYHFVIVDYICNVEQGELRSGGDADDAVWADPADLEPYHLTDGTVHVIRRSLGRTFRREMQ